MPKARTKSKLPIEIAAHRAASSHVCTQTSDPRFTVGLHSTNVGAGCSCHSTGTDHLRSRTVPLHLSGTASGTLHRTDPSIHVWRFTLLKDDQ
jgi:hypothetical protein